MAHCQKFTRSAVGHMFEHYNRTGSNHNRTENNIDRERTKDNYLLTFRPDDERSEKEFIEDRLSELTFRQQKNNVVFADWCITLPKDFEGDKERFFSLTAEFIGNRYGQENVIGCYVHLDETTPHMHCSFIPVKTDEKGIERLSSKVIDKADLKSFHDDLEHYLDRNHCHARLLNGRTEQEHIRAEKAEYARQFMEKEFSYQIRQDPTFYDRMNKYIDKEMSIDKDVITKDNIEKDKDMEHEHNHNSWDRYTPKA